MNAATFPLFRLSDHIPEITGLDACLNLKLRGEIIWRLKIQTIGNFLNAEFRGG